MHHDPGHDPHLPPVKPYEDLDVVQSEPKREANMADMYDL